MSKKCLQIVIFAGFVLAFQIESDAQEAFPRVVVSNSPTEPASYSLTPESTAVLATVPAVIKQEMSTENARSEEAGGGPRAGQCLTGGCSNFNSNFPIGTFSTTSSSFTTVAANVFGGEYAFYSVTSGSTYEWTLCSGDGASASYDSQLSLWNQGGTTTYCYSDDYCGDDANISWTATFTGTVRVLVSQYNCVNNTTNTTLRWRRASVALPDLSPYQRPEWNDKIPIGITQLGGTATHNYTGPFPNNQVLYFNWASNNQGTATASGYKVHVEVTGTGGQTWDWTGLTTPPNNHTYLTTDQGVGPLSGGSHTFRVWVDYDNSVAESNEGNNYYERTISVDSTAFGGQVTNCSGGAALSGATVTWGSFSTTTDGSGNYSFSNLPCQTNALIVSKSGYVTYNQSYMPICNASNVKNVCLNAVSLPDLTPYQRPEWNDRIPIGITQLGGTVTHNYTGPYLNNQVLYFNWASNNQGTATASCYTVHVEVTGTGGQTWDWTCLTTPANTHTYLTTDQGVGPLATGSHTFKVWVDYGSTVTESNEANNYYERTIVVGCSAPSSDLCASAISIGGAPYGISMITTCATADGPGLHSCASGRSNNNVWFVFTPSTSGSYQISTCGSNYDTVLRAYTGSCGSLTEISGGCNDDNGPACSGTAASLQVSLNAGATYRIEAASFNPGGGGLEFSFDVLSTPEIRIESTTLNITSCGSGAGVLPAELHSETRFNIAGTKDSLIIDDPQLANLTKERLHVAFTTVVQLSIPDEPGASFAVLVPIEGEFQRLELQPFSTRAQNFQVLVQNADGNLVPVEPEPPRTYRGSVAGIPESRVAASLLRTGLEALIVLPDHRRYIIEPLVGKVVGANRGLHAVYRSSDVLSPEGHCGTEGETAADVGESNEVAGGACGGSLCVAELACDADVEYFQDYGSVAAVQNRIQSVINSMNVEYESEVQIRHELTTIIVRSTEPDPYGATNSDDLVCQLLTEWTNNQSAIQRDVAKLFTGKNIDGSVIGQATNFGQICANTGVCNPGSALDQGAYCYSQNDFSTNFSCATDLAAHELGHLWGGTHCNCLGTTMHTPIQCANTFAAVSVSQIVAHRDSVMCLSPPGGASSFTIYNDGNATLDVTSINEQTGSCWLSITPAPPYSIAQGGQQVVTVLINSGCISPGSYSDRLLVNSNDSDESPYPGGVYVNLTLNAPPSITQQPSSGTVCQGQPYQFCVSASGTSPLNYQWQQNGTDIPGATSFCYTTTQSGSYRCRVSNECASVTSNSATLTVNSPPSISQQPQSSGICDGQSHQLCIISSGTNPLAYLWKKDGVDIPGATSSCYSVTQAGSYKCTVTNSCDTQTSASASISIVDVPTWTNLMPATGPSARRDHAMSCDVDRNVTVLFGGIDASLHGDTWEWDGAAWLLRSTTGPSARTDHAMAYDSTRMVTVLFGGYNNNFNGETWEWNGSLWQLRATTGPSPRAGHAMAYDSSRGVTVLFGGLSGQFSGQTWEWNGTAWTLGAAGGPSPRMDAAMAFDRSNGEIVLFGGSDTSGNNAETWTLDGTGWTLRSTTGPGKRGEHTLVFDSAHMLIILFGGIDWPSPLGDTWVWDGATWRSTGAAGPTARYDQVMAFDAAHGTLLMNGGYDTALNGETWILSFPPSFRQQPQRQDICVGDKATFVASANGAVPISYQWRRNGADIAGATGSSYAIGNTSLSDAGTYDVIVTSACGSATSNPASLLVTAAGSGDVNFDGNLDGLDIQRFVSALFDGGLPGAWFCAADMNGDATVTETDIPLLVNALLGSP